MKKKIYVSIPISHLNYDEQKAHAERIEKYLENFYDEVLSPFRNGVDMDAHVSQHMRADYKMLLEADSIFMCKGWEDSRGCRDELMVATDCHMEVLYELNHAEYFR